MTPGNDLNTTGKHWDHISPQKHELNQELTPFSQSSLSRRVRKLTIFPFSIELDHRSKEVI
jgi:hypothetical protein